MTITEKYIDKIKASLSPCQKKKFKDGMGWSLACPFCRDAQKRQSKCDEKCASLYPAESTFTYFFSCNRGLNVGVQGVQSCNHTMKFSTFLKRWHPFLYKMYVREKEMAKKNYQSGKGRSWGSPPRGRLFLQLLTRANTPCSLHHP